MNNNDKIDSFFKERTSNIEVYPSDKVWENIDSELFGSKGISKKSIVLWTLATLILLVGSFGAWMLISSGNDQTMAIPKIASDQKAIVNSSNNAEVSFNSDKKSIIKPINSISNTTYTNEENTNTPISEETANQNISNDLKTISNDKAYPIIKITKDFSKKSLTITNPVDLKYTNSINNNISPNIIDYQNINSIEEYIERRKRVHMYTGISASIAMAYYPTTADQSTWTTDFIYGLKLNKFYIETGLGYQKMKEQGVYQIDYRTNDSVGYYNKVLGFELNPANPNEITYKTKTTTVFDSIDHFILQSPIYTYGYLVFPVKVGYRFLTKKHFSVSFESGIIYSLLNEIDAPKVNYNNPESRLIGITNNTPSRVDHNFRLHLALKLNYSITKSVSANIQPEFTKFINSVYSNNPDYRNIKPYTMGVRFGILFDF